MSSGFPVPPYDAASPASAPHLSSRSPDDLQCTSHPLAFDAAPSSMAAEAQEEELERLQIGCLFFWCGQQHWGVRLSDIYEVIMRDTVMPVVTPQSPVWFTGAFPFEMQIASLIDLDQFLAPPAVSTCYTPHPKGSDPDSDLAILIVEYERDIFGLQVKQASSAIMLDPEEIVLVPLQERMEHEMKYCYARYVSQGDAPPSLHDVQGILDVWHLVIDIRTHLQSGWDQHV